MRSIKSSQAKPWITAPIKHGITDAKASPKSTFTWRPSQLFTRSMAVNTTKIAAITFITGLSHFFRRAAPPTGFCVSFNRAP